MLKLLNGNFKELIKEIKDNSVDLIVTDPPYKTTKRGNSGGTGGMLKNKEFIGGKGGLKNNSIQFNEWTHECFRVLKQDSHAYFMTNFKNLENMLNELRIAGFSIFKVLIWDKISPITNMWYMDSHEFIIFARKGKARKINNCGTKSIISIKNLRNKVHPNEKPVELLKILIENSIKENSSNIIFDPFMGTGSACKACIDLGVDFIGFEIDEEYFNSTVECIKQYTQQEISFK